MGITSVGASTSSSAIKAVQTGSAAGAGSVTITAVNVNKSFVQVFGTNSSGTVSASFGLSVAANATHTVVGGGGFGASPSPITTNNNPISPANNFWWTYNSAAINAANYNVNAGSNNLVSAVVQGYLQDATTLVVSGACRWQVVEFN